MSLSPYALIDNIQDVYDYLVFSDDQKVQYASTVEGWINAVTGLLERLCNRKLIARDFSVEQDGNGKRYILLDNYPVQEITAITVSTYDFQSTYTIDPSDEIVFDPDTGKVTILSGGTVGAFYFGHQNIHFEYAAGYTDEFDLAAFRDAALDLIAVRWGHMGKDPLELVRSDRIGNNQSSTYFDPRRLPHVAQQMVNMYRRMEV